MNILFVHQNFPGQFLHLAPALAAAQGHAVVALSLREKASRIWRGVRIVPYECTRSSSRDIHPWVSDLETKIIRAEACLRAARSLRAEGFVPDVIVAHPGWGESLFLKDVWPAARLGIYCEFFYNLQGADVGFDPEFPGQSEVDASRLRVKNANNLLHFDIADAGLSPTQWQASTFPSSFRERITIAHDGVDTEALRPRPDVQMTLDSLAGRVTLTRDDEVITFVSRNLEPYRGFHTFMRALPELLRQRPGARILIVGGNDVSYGTPPADGRNWRTVLTQEVRPRVPDEDWRRVHFLGKLDYERFISVLRLSRVHVYLTYPFVLSWSLLEAMSVGCAIVGSDTAPVREVIHHEREGLLTDFFDPSALAGTIQRLLDDSRLRASLGANARASAIKRFDLRSVCLPAQLSWVHGLVRDGSPILQPVLG